MKELKVDRAETAALMSHSQGLNGAPEDCQDVPEKRKASETAETAADQALRSPVPGESRSGQAHSDQKLVAVVGSFQAAPLPSPALSSPALSPREPVTPMRLRVDSDAFTPSQAGPRPSSPQTFPLLRRPGPVLIQGIAPRMPSPAWSRSNSPGLTPLTPDRQGSPRVPHVLAFRATSPPRDTSPPPQSPVSNVSRPLIWQAPQPQARQGLQGPGPQGAQGQSTRPCTPRNVSPAGFVSASGPPAGGFVWGAKLQPQAASWQPPRLQSPPRRAETPASQRPLQAQPMQATPQANPSNQSTNGQHDPSDPSGPSGPPAPGPPGPPGRPGSPGLHGVVPVVPLPGAVPGPPEGPEGPRVPKPANQRVLTPLRMPVQSLPMPPSTPVLKSLRAVLQTPIKSAGTPVQTPRQTTPFTPFSLSTPFSIPTATTATIPTMQPIGPILVAQPRIGQGPAPFATAFPLAPRLGSPPSRAMRSPPPQALIQEPQPTPTFSGHSIEQQDPFMVRHRTDLKRGHCGP
ncbi:unnamed protein product [Cladocopium goreaui]|uniref:Uncharacterized protein n=1 Tax=Cladocopium goreaui TaxID=2562237 RepID=A0A9P1C1P4_9DINO|nr:unnamed protein product [Cladocopium goreaui]